MVRNWRQIILGVGLLIVLSAWTYTFFSPLEGIHEIRQADTLFSGYSYCKEDTEFLKPRIAHRENTSGIAIGELPAFSYLISLPCQWTGVWTEWAPKLITWILLILSFFVWSLWFRRFYPERWPGYLGFAILFFCSTQVQVHWAIPIPDVLVVLLMGVMLLIQDSQRWLSILIFALCFWIRPYYLPLLALVNRKTLWPVYVAPCLGIYFFWYKHWIQYSEIQYYNTRVIPISELIQVLPQTLLAVATRVLRNELNFVGLIFLWFAWRKIRYDYWLWLVAVAALVFIIGLKGDHLMNHGYYLGAFSVMALILMAFGLKQMSEARANWVLLVYILVLVANVQHLWRHRGLEMQAQMQALLAEQQVSESAKIATFVTSWPQDPTYLYWAKRTGWAIAERDFDSQKPCPEKADFYLLREQGELKLHPCLRQ